MSAPIIVVTDLDGTLLDHHDYSWRQAEPGLRLLRDRHIPLVLCSSKTVWEMLPLRQALDNDEPIVAENGAAIYLPGDGEDSVLAFGLPRPEILAILARLRQEEGVDYRGFNDMTVEEVMAATGLDHTAALNARRREYTEPLLWQDTPAKLERFRQRLGEAGLDSVAGGRFLHVSAGCDKGRAVDWLRDYYGKRLGEPVSVIALGDSDNDVGMLEKADLPVLVRSPVKPFPRVDHDRVYRTEAIGPAGWAEAVTNLLNQHRT